MKGHKEFIITFDDSSNDEVDSSSGSHVVQSSSTSPQLSTGQSSSSSSSSTTAATTAAAATTTSVSSTTRRSDSPLILNNSISVHSSNGSINNHRKSKTSIDPLRRVETRWNRESRQPVDNLMNINENRSGVETTTTTRNNDNGNHDDDNDDNHDDGLSIEYKEDLSDENNEMIITGVLDNNNDNDNNNDDNDGDVEVRYHYRKGTFRDNAVNMTQSMKNASSTTTAIITTTTSSTDTAGTKVTTTTGVRLRKKLHCKVILSNDRLQWCETILKLGNSNIQSNIDFY